MDPDAVADDVVRVLVCDDSRTFAAGLTRILEHDHGIRVVRAVASAEEALRVLPSVQPDLVTMDVELPGMNGLEATRRILSQHRVPVVVISAFTPKGSELSAGALTAGAVDAVAKDNLRVDDPTSLAALALRRRIRRLGRANAVRVQVNGRGPVSPPGAGSHTAEVRRRRPTVVAIGASTGGPQALLSVLSTLPADYPLPVMVVQHMSRGFTEGLARWLNGQVQLPVAIAEDRSLLRRGVWFAPEGVHLGLDRSLRMSLNRSTGAVVHCPAVDVLLQSVATVAGAGAVGVILTGMGRDGAEGVVAVREAGGLTIAQDESTSVVFGMPRAAVESGAELVLPLHEIGALLGRLGTRTRAS